MAVKKAKWYSRSISFLPAAAWYCLIWSFSSQNADQSGNLSDSLLYRLLAGVSPHFADASSTAQAAAVELLSFFERKAAHMFLYFVLFLLLCFAWRFFVQGFAARTVLPALACAILAGVDEWHQTMVPGRSGEVWDVCVDLCGVGIAVVFLTLPYLASRCRKGFSIFPSALILVAGYFPLIFWAIWGMRLMNASHWLVYQISRFVPEIPDANSVAVVVSLVPVLWDVIYLVLCGVAGVCTLTATFLMKMSVRASVAVCAANAVWAALLTAGGSVGPITAASLTLLGVLCAALLWGLGIFLFFPNKSFLIESSY